MHGVVEEILRSTRARLDDQVQRTDLWLPGEREKRDLISSAESVRSKGLTPIVAEIKPRVLGRSLEPGEVIRYASLYERMGACAISVLTQPAYFLGALENASMARESTGLPVLRKDFILDRRQISEVEADLVLLIAAFSHPLEEMVETALSWGMEPLVEVHTEEELDLALKTEARILGINNRNLKTLEVDLGTFERLGPQAKSSGAFVVAESGIETREDACRMEEAGADALLVGTSLMKEPTRLLELNGKVIPR